MHNAGMASLSSLSDEFANLIKQYDNELKGYKFDDFSALEKDSLGKFLQRVRFSHEGGFTRIYKDSVLLVARSREKQQSLPELRLFDLTFDVADTGSSGVPHVHEDLEEFDMDRLRVLEVQECDTPLYRRRHWSDEDGKILYSRELHVQVALQEVVRDVIASCKYSLKTDMEAALNGLRVDIGMLRNSNNLLCGIIEVKQPKRKNRPHDPEPMDHPKIVTQVVSQMIPLRTMYGVQNVYGILSTYSSWRFFQWTMEDVCGDIQMINSLSKEQADIDDYPFLTPQSKTGKSNSQRNRRVSPPMSPKPYVDTGMYEEEEEDEEVTNPEYNECVHRGVLYASDIMPAGQQALRMLAWVLREMESSPVAQVPAHERDFLYIVQKDAMGGYEKLVHTTDYYKSRLPNSRNSKLYMLEELGHRHHGRVFRAMSKNGNLCVIKYFTGNQKLRVGSKIIEMPPEAVAIKSAELWNKAYQNWLPPAMAGKWGGGDAVVMPDLQRMTMDDNRDAVATMLELTLRTRFFVVGLWHGDPAWRNVALVRNADGDLTKACMIDIDPHRMIEKADSDEWDFVSMWEDFKSQLEHDWDAFLEASGHGNVSQEDVSESLCR